jgi:hypothetical protein
MSEERFHQLFVLNVALQLFDGLATWHGVCDFGEGNPLLAAFMAYLGVGLTVLLFKAKACGCLVVLRRCWRHPVAADAMLAITTLYGGFSFVPWMARYVSLLAA